MGHFTASLGFPKFPIGPPTDHHSRRLMALPDHSNLFLCKVIKLRSHEVRGKTRAASEQEASSFIIHKIIGRSQNWLRFVPSSCTCWKQPAWCSSQPDFYWWRARVDLHKQFMVRDSKRMALHRATSAPRGSRAPSTWVSRSSPRPRPYRLKHDNLYILNLLWFKIQVFFFWGFGCPRAKDNLLQSCLAKRCQTSIGIFPVHLFVPSDAPLLHSSLFFAEWTRGVSPSEFYRSGCPFISPFAYHSQFRAWTHTLDCAHRSCSAKEEVKCVYHPVRSDRVIISVYFWWKPKPHLLCHKGSCVGHFCKVPSNNHAEPW